MLKILKETLLAIKAWMLYYKKSSLATCFFACFISIGLFFAFGPSGPIGLTENTAEVEIYIPEGSGLNEISKVLVDEGVLSHRFGFILKVMANGQSKNLQAGEYLVTRKMPLRNLVKKIATGDIIHRAFTVVEGATVRDTVAKLNQISILKDEIMDVPPEGSLFPATYPYHRGESRLAILKRMKESMHHTIQELWENRSAYCPLKTPQEALIMASIIEKETSKRTDEQPTIAGVFINRMFKERMKLQSDPTVIYALTLGAKSLGRSLTSGDLKYNSPYNTYKHPGLPPAPISCPGREALKAAMNPEMHDKLFFVADGTGGHAFSKTLAEHNRHVQKWRQFRASSSE